LVALSALARIVAALAICYPPEFSALDRSQIERALKAAIPVIHLDGVGSSVMPRRYASEAAAIRAVVAVCEVVAFTLTSPRPMVTLDRHAAAIDLRDQIIAWVYAWLPSSRTQTFSAFAAEVRDEVATRLFWMPFRVADVDRGVGTFRRPV